MAGPNGIASGVHREEEGEGGFRFFGFYEDLIRSGEVQPDWLPDAPRHKKGMTRRRTYTGGRLIEAERLASGKCRVYVMSQSRILSFFRMDNLRRGQLADHNDAFDRIRARDRGYARFLMRATEKIMSVS